MRKITKLLLKRVAVLLVAMLVFFVLCEITLRIFGVSSGYDYPRGLFQEDNLLGYSMTPYFKGELIKPEFRTSIHTNSQGLRDQEYGKKSVYEFRILALGDSCTWGAYGTDLEETYLKLLEKKLNELGSKKKFSVINSGIPGYNTMQEYLYLRERGIHYEPDLVLLTIALNDFLENPTNWKDVIIKDGVRVTNKKTFLLEIRSFFLMNFWSYRVIERGITILLSNYAPKFWFSKEVEHDQHLKIFSKENSFTLDKNLNLTFSILDDINALLKEKNISFVIIVMPLKYQVDDALKEKFIEVNNLNANDLDFDKPQSVIKNWTEENDVVFIELLPVLRRKNKDNYFYWNLNPHFNKRGNEEVANIVFGELRTLAIYSE